MKKKIKEGKREKMNGKNLVNLQIAIEEVENIDGLVSEGYYGCRSDAKNLTEGILRSINRFVDESLNLKVRKVVGKRMNGKILVNMQIAAEGIENVDALSEKDIGGVDGITIKEKSSAY
ncbi:MAG: hypothetical protein WBD09_05575 [Halobacteriota archaeon]